MIRKATRRDADGVAAVLAAAFKEDPAFKRIMGEVSDPRDRLTELFTFQLRKHYLKHGVVDILEEDGEICGVALWDTPHSLQSTIDQLVMVPDYFRVFGTDVVRIFRQKFRSSKYHPHYPHWYLYTIAIAPNQQGKGIGSQLLNHGIERAGEDAIFLEASTPDSQRLYERLGFFALGPIPTDDEHVNEMGMWKPAAETAVERKARLEEES